MNYLRCLVLTSCMLLSACNPDTAGNAVDHQAPARSNPEISEPEPRGLEATPETVSSQAQSIAMGESSPGPATVKPNVIRWSTASELNSYGYDVYRGPSEDGPFSVINDEVIPGAGTTDLPNRYEYVDHAVEPDTIYWYYIESVSLSGERKQITPVYPSHRKPADKE